MIAADGKETHPCTNRKDEAPARKFKTKVRLTRHSPFKLRRLGAMFSAQFAENSEPYIRMHRITGFLKAADAQAMVWHIRGDGRQGLARSHLNKLKRTMYHSVETPSRQVIFLPSAYVRPA